MARVDIEEVGARVKALQHHGDTYNTEKFEQTIGALRELTACYANGQQRNYDTLFSRHQTDLMVELRRAGFRADEAESVANAIVTQFQQDAGYDPKQGLRISG